MSAKCSSLLLQLFCLTALLSCCYGSYIITTPRKWTSGEATQVCVFLQSSAPTEAPNTLTVELSDDTEVLIPGKVIQVPAGETKWCTKVSVPVIHSRSASLKVTGTLSDKEVDYTKRISIAKGMERTFVQTDKYMYKPGQNVQFRILSVTGPYLRIMKENYPLVWIETPSGSRIAQWSEVNNSAGLVHLSFKLADEPEEGSYAIKVRTSADGPTTRRDFKVQDYVLPRFQVEIIPPKYILGTDDEFSFTVCAKYTYGQPVRGNVTLEIDNGGWGSSKIKHVIKEKIMGCKELRVLADEVALNGEDFYVYNLIAKASVVEEGTDQEFKADSSVSIHRTALQFKDIGKEEYIKPNLPFTGKVKVTLPDGSPAAGEPMQVCAGGKCKNITTEAHGILEFVIPTYSSESTQIRALNYPQVKSPTSRWRSIMYPSNFHHSLKRYYSPSNSSLVIHVPENRLPCVSKGEISQKLTLPVLFSAVNQTRATFTIQVVSRGQVQYFASDEYELSSGNLPINEEHLVESFPPTPESTIQGVINIPFQLPRSASPSAKILVWYTRPDGEVVSDTQVVEIEKCFENDVNLVWSAARVQPGEQATLDLSADPNSFCSLGVVDKSVELLSSQHDDLTLDKVFEIVENAMISEWENEQSNEHEYCRTWNEKNKPDTPPPPPPFIPEPPGPPGIPVPLAETPPLERAPVVKRSSPWRWPYYSNYVDALKMFDKSGLYILTDLTTETRPCEVMDMPIGLVSSISRRGPGVVMNAVPRVETIPRQNIPSSFVEEDETAKVQRTYFPETWLWQLKLLYPSGVLSEQYTLPDTITEWVGKAVCVNSETGLGISEKAAITTFTPFFVDLTLPPSIKRGEVLPVKISVFNYLEQALPVKVILEESSEYEIVEEPGSQLPLGHRIACIAPQEKTVHTVKIRSLVLGDVNITIDAFVDELYPEACGPEYVISKRDVLIKPIKVEAEGFPREKAWTKYICSKDINENADFLENWRIEAPPVIVKDSARGWVTAVGDLLGPTLENLGSLVRMPYGCGEQNMLNFAPNIFILQYLDASSQTTPEIAKKAIDYMKQGYQRELRYRHNDGSFSAFGNSDASGSTWLTAFVLKSFAQARQYIQIDEDDLNMSRAWLQMKQLENGCFQSVGKVFHKGMKGGIDGSSSPVPLTSYVLIALLESGELISSRAVMDAAFCLHADTSKDPYSLALKAYALALSEAPEAEQAMQNLLNVATESSNSLYWELPAGSGKSEAVAVETAGYAILAMMTLDANLYENQARKIVKWISSQRNGQGGFISTQDTVVALQALASFEGHQKKESVNLVMLVQAEGVEHSFFIDESNKLLQQQVNLPSIPTNVILDMEGQGCALMQAVLRYNVPDAVGSDAFALSITTETSPDKKCITKKVKACASYLLPDQKSNMAVMEFNLVSGYIPHKDDLKQIVGYGTGLLKRYEVDGSKVDFYIDEFSPEDICVEFRIIREIDVEDAKPGTVRVYDYYQPEFSVSKTYILPPTDECLIELVPIEAIAIEDEIIVDYEYEEEGTTTTDASDAVRDLVGALDDII